MASFLKRHHHLSTLLHSSTKKALVYNDGLTIYEITNIHQIKKETGDKAIKWYDSLENKHRLSIEDFKKIQKLQKEGEEIPSNSDILFINITTRRQPDWRCQKNKYTFFYGGNKKIPRNMDYYIHRRMLELVIIWKGTQYF